MHRCRIVRPFDMAADAKEADAGIRDDRSRVNPPMMGPAALRRAAMASRLAGRPGGPGTFALLAIAARTRAAQRGGRLLPVGAPFTDAR